jgi:hypothetical protein
MSTARGNRDRIERQPGSAPVNINTNLTIGQIAAGAQVGSESRFPTRPVPTQTPPKPTEDRSRARLAGVGSPSGLSLALDWESARAQFGVDSE